MPLSDHRDPGYEPFTALPPSDRDGEPVAPAYTSSRNRDPLAVVGRLWPRLDLDPEVEKLGFSS